MKIFNNGKMRFLYDSKTLWNRRDPAAVIENVWWKKGSWTFQQKKRNEWQLLKLPILLLFLYSNQAFLKFRNLKEKLLFYFVVRSINVVFTPCIYFLCRTLLHDSYLNVKKKVFVTLVKYNKKDEWVNAFFSFSFLLLRHDSTFLFSFKLHSHIFCNPQLIRVPKWICLSFSGFFKSQSKCHILFFNLSF